jgi:hypothetical protein
MMPRLYGFPVFSNRPIDKPDFQCADKLKMSLDDFDKLICSTLDEKDIQYVEEALARLQYGKDLARLEASRKHLESTVAANKKAHVEVAVAQKRANQAGLGARYRAISSKRQDVFTKTSFYLMTLPYVLSYIGVRRRAAGVRQVPGGVVRADKE